jgi:hypothetical protein
MDVDPESRQYIYNYWKLKRKVWYLALTFLWKLESISVFLRVLLLMACSCLQAGFNKPLLPPKSEDVDILSHQQEQADLEKMKMFVQLRQDLERVSITVFALSLILCIQGVKCELQAT